MELNLIEEKALGTGISSPRLEPPKYTADRRVHSYSFISQPLLWLAHDPRYAVLDALTMRHTLPINAEAQKPAGTRQIVTDLILLSESSPSSRHPASSPQYQDMSPHTHIDHHPSCPFTKSEPRRLRPRAAIPHGLHRKHAKA